jgi:hypothetical protein
MRLSLVRRRLSLVSGLTAALLAVAGCNFDLSTGAEAREPWQRTYKLAAGGTLEVRNTNGLVKFEVTDGDSIEVRAERIVRAGTDQAAKDALAAFTIRETASPERVSIDATSSSTGIMIQMSRRVEFHVRVPRATNLKIETTNGDIELGGAALSGTFQAGTTNGRIRATGLENTTRANTTNGTIELQVSKLGEDGITCETTNGPIELAVAPDTNAVFSARVTNGAIRHQGLNIAVSEQSRRRLDGTIGRGGPPIKLETTNGEIEIRAMTSQVTGGR